MSELLTVDKEKGLRKRRSTTAIREEDESRKKHAPGDEGEEIGDMTEMMMTEIRGKMKAKDMNEQKARDNGLRVEKKARTGPRSVCCRCKKITGVNRDGECLECGHRRCPECIIQN